MSTPCSDWRGTKSWRDGPRSPTGYRRCVFIPVRGTGWPWIGNRERSPVKSLLEVARPQQGGKCASIHVVIVLRRNPAEGRSKVTILATAIGASRSAREFGSSSVGYDGKAAVRERRIS